ncbi:FmdB family zinc ribbon protein [Leucobacter sp. 1207-22]|uniref:FmdB family zinc ribbon protein n=1 Tax=Leucobacter sp. 1207-22 TaxID=2604456 RepID=UPI004063352E
MPNYRFRCQAGCEFDALYAMADVPRETQCRSCDGTATRLVTAPHLSGAGSSAYGLIDRAAQSAHEPQVVTGLPSASQGPPKRQPVTYNPLHAKLPRP